MPITNETFQKSHRFSEVNDTKNKEVSLRLFDSKLEFEASPESGRIVDSAPRTLERRCWTLIIKWKRPVYSTVRAVSAALVVQLLTAFPAFALRRGIGHADPLDERSAAVAVEAGKVRRLQECEGHPRANVTALLALLGG